MILVSHCLCAAGNSDIASSGTLPEENEHAGWPSRPFLHAYSYKKYFAEVLEPVHPKKEVGGSHSCSTPELLKPFTLHGTYAYIASFVHFLIAKEFGSSGPRNCVPGASSSHEGVQQCFDEALPDLAIGPIWKRARLRAHVCPVVPRDENRASSSRPLLVADRVGALQPPPPQRRFINPPPPPPPRPPVKSQIPDVNAPPPAVTVRPKVSQMRTRGNRGGQHKEYYRRYYAEKHRRP